MQGLNEHDKLLRRLNRQRARARAVLLFERVWPALWPPLGLFGLFLCLALLGLPPLLPAVLHLLVLIGLAVGVLGLAARGLRGLVRPDNAAADRRLEQASGLRHRPLAALADRPASVRGAAADAAGSALWRAHVERAASAVRRLRVGLPHPGLPARDRRALRGALVVALAAAFGIAGADAPARLARAFSPDLPIMPASVPGQLQAWITPPAYTGLPPQFLHAEGGAVSAPAGAHVTISLTGGALAGSSVGDRGTPSVVIGGHEEPFQALDANSFQADRELTSGGRLLVRRHGHDLVAWDLTVIADLGPTVTFPEPPGQLPRSTQVRLPWQVADEYGVAALEGELRLRDRPDAPPLIIGIPLPGGRTKAAHGAFLTDQTAHPWAGLPVTARLVARDAAGHQGISTDAAFTLPERRFENPVARALVALRRALSLHPDDRRTAIAGLTAIGDSPDAFDNDVAVFLTLRATAALLHRERGAGAIAEAQDRMWQLALRLEEAAPERTARALEDARQAARDALAAQTREPSPQHQAEFERKLEELRRAIDRHMQALADQARREQQNAPPEEANQQQDAVDLDKLSQAAQDAARAGRTEEAREKLAELERLLDQLQAQAGQHGAEAQKNAAKRQRGRQEMGALQDLVRRQSGVLDHAQSRSTDPGVPEDDKAQRDTDRRVQQALRRALGELMQQFGDLTGKVPKSLSDADSAMHDAGQDLAQSRDDDAGTDAQRAIEALQKGGHDMSQAMAEQFGRGQEGETQAEGQASDGQGDDDSSDDPNGQQSGKGRGHRGMAQGGEHGHRREAHRDPLGRHLQDGASGLDEGTDVAVPDEMEQQRTRAIVEELRRRGGERARPQEELDYIDRLLEPF